MANTHICCICGKEYEGYGNNPEPIKDFSSGSCCDDCNTNLVIPARMGRVFRKHVPVVKLDV